MKEGSRAILVGNYGSLPKGLVATVGKEYPKNNHFVYIYTDAVNGRHPGNYIVAKTALKRITEKKKIPDCKSIW
jgi:hypothetical protein